MNGVGQVVLHGTDSPFPVSGVEKLLAEACGTPEVHLENRVASVGEPLNVGAVAPDIPSPGAAVNKEDQRQSSLSFESGGYGQITDQGETVSGLDDYRGHLGELVL